jgi:hypothetical protein
MRHATARNTLDTYGHLWREADESTRSAIGAGIAERMDSLGTTADEMSRSVVLTQVRPVNWPTRRSTARTATRAFTALSCLEQARNMLVRALTPLSCLDCRENSCGPTAVRCGRTVTVNLTGGKTFRPFIRCRCAIPLRGMHLYRSRSHRRGGIAAVAAVLTTQGYRASPWRPGSRRRTAGIVCISRR